MMRSHVTTLQWIDRGMWPKSIKMMVCVSCSFFIFFVGYTACVRSLFESYDQAVQAWHVELVKFAKKHEAASQFFAYRRQVVELQAQLDFLLKKWPRKSEVPILFEAISNLGIRLGLTFELFMPEKETHYPFYVELPIQIVVVGRYQQLALFLSQVVQFDRLITIHDFTIEQKNHHGSVENKALHKEKLVMKVMIKLYRYL